MASIYDINFNIFVNENLPPNKREEKQKAWLGALVTPLQTLHDDIFNVYRPDVIARAKHNGQKIIMESVLNSTFGVVAPPYIYIDNTGDDKRPETFYNEFEGYPPQTFFNESELEPPFYFVNQSETIQNNDFKVYVPSAVLASFGSPLIASEVDRLRPYSTNYLIISY